MSEIKTVLAVYAFVLCMVATVSAIVVACVATLYPVYWPSAAILSFSALGLATLGWWLLRKEAGDE